MSNRRKLVPWVLVFIPAFMGLVNFYNVAHKPRFETFYTVDVVQLIVTGMCLGAVLVVLVMFFRGPRSS